MKRNPRRGSVCTKRGLSAVSPSAARSWPMQYARPRSKSTCVPDAQRCARISSRVTTSPARESRSDSARAGCGSRDTMRLDRLRTAASASNSNTPKRNIIAPRAFWDLRASARGRFVQNLSNAAVSSSAIAGVAVLDLRALEHVDDLAAAHDRDRRRRGAIAGEMLPRAIGAPRRRPPRTPSRPRQGVRVTQRHRNARPRLARGAPAHRVDHDHERAWRAGNRGVDLFRRAELLDAEVGQFLRMGSTKNSG